MQLSNSTVALGIMYSTARVNEMIDRVLQRIEAAN